MTNWIILLRSFQSSHPTKLSFILNSLIILIRYPSGAQWSLFRRKRCRELILFDFIPDRLEKWSSSCYESTSSSCSSMCGWKIGHMCDSCCSDDRGYGWSSGYYAFSYDVGHIRVTCIKIVLVLDEKMDVRKFNKLPFLIA